MTTARFSPIAAPTSALRSLRPLAAGHAPASVGACHKRPRLGSGSRPSPGLTSQASRDTFRTRVAMPLAPEAPAAPSPDAGCSSDDEVQPPKMSDLSYNRQHAELFAEPLNLRRTVPKPVRGAQADEPGARKVLLSDVYAVPKRRLFFGREWNAQDLTYGAFMLVMHGLAALAPWTFSWPMVGLFFATYFVTGCLGITLSYHRQLSHRSFTTPKWVEYALAYCGAMAVQGDPLEWVSSHRYHHLHCDTPLDPHSPYEGFWWSHMGWLLDNSATLERVHDRSNASDMAKDPFYAHLARWYGLHVAAQLGALFALGGLPALVWGGALRIVWVYHITWFVNSAAHVWGTQPYNTGDLSRNNWWVGVLAFGEGWHNNHHAFEFSARHGLEWWQIDMTWWCIKALQALGLADNVKLPSEKQKARLAVAQ